ncbi:MAG: hypothetical protein C4326_03055 [Ignavibacteria bacterium]
MELSNLRRFFLSLIIILALTNLPGCSIGSYIGAYFNTFYNAQKAFNEAEADVLGTSSPQTVVQRTERPYLAPFDVPPQTKAKFSTAIEKCSKLLQYHPDSKLVDDALLMIGKSYYYQNDLQAAQRKFNELLTSYPESDLALEAKLLLAQTHYRNNDLTTAMAVAAALLEEAQARGEDAITAETARLIAHVHRQSKNYAEALRHFTIAARLGATAEDRATAYRRIAEMHIELKEYKQAAEAFAKAEDEGATFISKYRGLIGRARMLSKLGRHEESLAMLEEMVKNNNFREFFGEISLEIGNVYRDQQDYASAEQQYRYVDTAYARTDVAANAYYQLGRLYETHFGNYDSARAAYDKGKFESPSAEITAELLRRSEYFAMYFTYRNEILRNDSLHCVILFPPDTTQLATRDTTTRDSTAHTPGKGDTLVTRAPTVPPPPLDTVLARLAHNKSELASLFYTALHVVDSAKYWYERLVTDHPTSRYVPGALYTLAQIARQDSLAPAQRADSLLRVIVERFPESEFADEARRVLGMPATVREEDTLALAYREAEGLIQQGDYTRALRRLQTIAKRDSSSPYSAKAQYAIGWIYENVQPNLDSSIASYERLVKRFPRSPYSSAVQPKLAVVEAERQKKNTPSAQDTTAIAPRTEKEPQKAPVKVIPDAPEAQKDSVFDDEVPKLRKKKE